MYHSVLQDSYEFLGTQVNYYEMGHLPNLTQKNCSSNVGVGSFVVLTNILKEKAFPF